MNVEKVGPAVKVGPVLPSVGRPKGGTGAATVRGKDNNIQKGGTGGAVLHRTSSVPPFSCEGPSVPPFWLPSTVPPFGYFWTFWTYMFCPRQRRSHLFHFFARSGGTEPTVPPFTFWHRKGGTVGSALPPHPGDGDALLLLPSPPPAVCFPVEAIKSEMFPRRGYTL